MKKRYFGTDGIRGRAGTDLTPELALRAAFEYAVHLDNPGRGRPTVVLAADPRLSSPLLRAACTAGICLAGVDVLDVGTVPTPVVPFVQQRKRLAGGLMITASHNPVHDNGLKFFGAGGSKISAQDETAIEAGIDKPGWKQQAASDSVLLGEVSTLDAAPEYLSWLLRQVKPLPAPLRIVLDCAYGATSQLAPLAFLEHGAELSILHGQFDGSRINVRSGATELSSLQAAVRARRADLGLAFDGDGDRMLAVDARGEAVSGDKIIALFALAIPRYRKRGAVVMTHMTNLGVEEALRRRGVEMVRTDVGDSLVAVAMRDKQIHLGGEQSGHIIMDDRLPTGDGILAGLQLAAIVACKGKPLHELVAEFAEFPQQLTNLTVKDKVAWRKDQQLQRDLRSIQSRHRDVRFYLRPSGTENLLRVLTESRDAAACRAANDAVCATFQAWDRR